jgi:hypothetical protein
MPDPCPPVLNFPNGNHRRYATERFIEIVWRGVQSDEDPRTLGLWAQISGTTRSPLSTLCRTLGLTPRSARDFTRLFRAIVRTSGNLTELHDMFDISEPTTLEELFTRAGLEYSVTLSPLEFLDRQRLVRNEHVLAALKRVVQVPLEPHAM